MNTPFLNEYRCKCGKLLLKGVFFDGTAEIKCRNCGMINKIGHTKLENDDTHYLLIVNNNGVVVNASSSAYKILNYGPNELIGKICNQIDHSVNKETHERVFGPNSILNEDNHFQFDTIHHSKDGKQIPVIVILRLYKPNDKEKYVLLSVAVKNNDFEKVSSITKNHTCDKEECDFYFEIDKDGRGMHISNSMEKLFGFSREEYLGKSYFDVLPPKQREEAKKDFEYFSAKQQAYRRVNNDAVCIDKKKNFSYEVYFVPNFSDTGKFIGYNVSGWLKDH